MEEATTPIEPSAAAVEAVDADATAAAHAEHPHGHHGPPTGFIRKYIFSIDHKVIGIQYLLLAIFAAFLGMFMSVLMRLNLTWPGHKWTILEKLFPLGAPCGVTALCA